jgi:hypothetical protein
MKIFFCLFLFIIAPMTWAQETVVPADSPLIQYSGRIDFTDPKAPRFDWPGVSILVGFKGSSIGFNLDDLGNNYDVQVDGKPVTVWTTSRNTTLYTMTGVAPGEHILKVVKRTEALFGSTTFKGISLPAGTTLFKAPDLPNRRIEIIGDSIACGYGIESSSVQCDSLRPYENADKAFGALLAQDLGAEYHLEAFSGKGVIRNWGDKQSRSADPFPPFLTQTLCREPKSAWDFSKWTPHAVIIHLGLNDFSTAPEADPKEFTKAYIDLLKQVREKYSKTVIFCVAPAGVYNLSYLLDKIVEKRTSAGDKNIFLLTYPPATSNLFGCDGHPNAMAQRQMADVLLQPIKDALYW